MIVKNSVLGALFSAIAGWLTSLGGGEPGVAGCIIVAAMNTSFTVWLLIPVFDLLETIKTQLTQYKSVGDNSPRAILYSKIVSDKELADSIDSLYFLLVIALLSGVVCWFIPTFGLISVAASIAMGLLAKDISIYVLEKYKERLNNLP